MYAEFRELQPRWGRSLIASVAVHVVLAASLVASVLLLEPPLRPDPAPIRVQLLRIAEPAATAPAVATPVAPPAARPPTSAVAKPKPIVPRAPKPAPSPIAAKPVAAVPRSEAVSSVDVAASPPTASGAAFAGSAAIGSSSGFASGRSAIGSGDALDAYIAQVRELIRKHKRYPALARRRGIEGRLVLSLAIAADGDVAVMNTSGAASSLLEDGARAAVAAASPLPPPPTGALRLDVPVRFDLTD